MSRYYAHSTDDRSKSDWQPLSDHLLGTSSRSAGFAARFGAEQWGRICGMLHDLGKFSAEFQSRLEGGPRVDHSAAGANEAIRRYGLAHGKLMAYVIAGHHTGLPDGGTSVCSDRKTLASRLSEVSVPAISGYEGFLAELPPTISPPVKLQDGSPGFSANFFIRMLYSCLVDADYLDTETWLDGARAGLRVGYPDIPSLLSRLDAYLDSLRPEPTRVNKHRAEILGACRRAAEVSPGIFSLTVPTGGGKTLSSLAFALRHAARHGLDRVIYVIPYTSIIEQNAAVFREALGDIGNTAVLEHHSNFDPSERDENEEGNYGNEPLRLQLASENWDAPVVVTTSVQFFESLFACRSSRCRKLHNVARSVVILDEVQILPTSLLLPCIAAIKELSRHYGTSVVLCTATQPALRKADWLPCGLDDGEVREIAPDPGALYKEFRRVDVTWAGTLSDADVARRIRSSKQVLCVVNTRAHARKLYEVLGPGDGHIHLSALMCPAHRTRKLDEIRRRLKDGMICRVVSTQLVEAGVDIDFPAVLRSAAGVDSIAQAAGRCNREGKLPGRGDVLVFVPENGLPPGYFQRAANVGEMTAREYSDLLSPGAVRHYFSTLYSFEGRGGLDRKELVRRIEENARSLDFPFREVAEDFRLIENVMDSLIIPYNAEAQERIEELRRTDFLAATARKIQKYTIQVPRRTMEALLSSGVVEVIRDRFHVLVNESLYRDDLGLCPEDPTFREQESNIF
jgi:CRISPR-associated endonuclease/helicase Cas3